jgi:phage baseplate assembly protein W
MAYYLNSNQPNKNTQDPSYSDLDADMILNPKTNDLLTTQNTRAVRRSIMNLLSTAYGERLFQPNIGASLRALLFEPIDPVSTFEMKDRIITTLRNHEPRISSLRVDVFSKPDENSYVVNIEFALRATGEKDKVTTVLERIR